MREYEPPGGWEAYLAKLPNRRLPYEVHAQATRLERTQKACGEPGEYLTFCYRPVGHKGPHVTWDDDTDYWETGDHPPTVPVWDTTQDEVDFFVPDEIDENNDAALEGDEEEDEEEEYPF